jgi:protein involved in polysaccharide export with SLBB domain
VTPGVYILQTRQERLLDVLRRAGGLTPQANPAGLRLVRRGELLATDLDRARAQPGGRYDVVLEEGDSISVPEQDPTVLVRGAVAFESRVLYRPGKDLDYYIAQSGGYTTAADKDRVSVTYQNGARAVPHRYFLYHSSPGVQPGSTILVPAKPEDQRQGFDWDQFLARTLSVVGTTVTILVAVTRL